LENIHWNICVEGEKVHVDILVMASSWKLEELFFMERGGLIIRSLTDRQNNSHMSIPGTISPSPLM
jgi:hypothetical protein